MNYCIYLDSLLKMNFVKYFVRLLYCCIRIAVQKVVMSRIVNFYFRYQIVELLGLLWWQL